MSFITGPLCFSDAANGERKEAAPSRGIATLAQSPITHTQNPYVTGTSVLGIKYRDGVLIAADCGGAYGSTLRYKSVERIKAIGKCTGIGASGELS
eukprot:c34990_g1_i1 orf=82-369(+)